MFSGRVGLSAVAGEATQIDLHDTPVVDRSVAHVIIKLGDGWGSPRLRRMPPIDLHDASFRNSIAHFIINGWGSPLLRTRSPKIDIHDASVVDRSVAQVGLSAVANGANQIDIHTASFGNCRPTHRPTCRPNGRPNDIPPIRPDNTSTDHEHDKCPSRCTPPKRIKPSN